MQDHPSDPRNLPHTGPVTYSPAEPGNAARDQAEAALTAIAGVQGVGLGQDEIGNPAWLAYVLDAGVAARVPRSIGGRRVIPLVTGTIDAQRRRR